MKIVLAGSPQISIPTFKKVINNFDVVAIVTQPDRKQGRGMALTETPVSLLGKKHNIKVFKPNKIIEIYEELEKLDYDIFLSFAYGQIIPQKVLDLGKFRPVNIHGSLLPKYRGASPIQYAILNGDKEIGITLIEMIDKMDAGDMYFKASEKITDQTTSGDGFEIISRLAENNIVEWLKNIESDKVDKKSQGDEFTLAHKISKSDAEIAKNDSLVIAKRKIKAYNPFPGAFIIMDNKRIKLFNFTNEDITGSIKIKLSDGELIVNEFQYEGKKRTAL